jgi:hypothetical protein
MAVLFAHPALQVAAPGQIQAEAERRAAPVPAAAPSPGVVPFPLQFLPHQAPDGAGMTPEDAQDAGGEMESRPSFFFLSGCR